MGADPLVVVAPRDRPLAPKARVSCVEVLTHEPVGMSPGGALDDHLAKHARRLGLRLRYRVRLRSLDEVWAKRSLIVCTRDIDALPMYARQLLASVMACRVA